MKFVLDRPIHKTAATPFHIFKLLPRAFALVALLAAAAWLAGCSSTEAPEEETPTGPIITTWAGTGTAAFDGDNNPLLESHFYYPVDLSSTSRGMYILDWNNHRIRRVTAQGTLITEIGTDILGDGDPNLEDRDPPGVPANTINLNHPTDMIELNNGKLLITCWHNHKLRLYDPNTGLAYVMCGDEAGYGGDEGPMRPALLNQPTVTVETSDGTLYILDQRNVRVRKITPGGVISTAVGTGVPGFAGDGGDPLTAMLNYGDPADANPPVWGGLALDEQERLYISDALNHRIRRVDFSLNKIETVVGDGNQGYGGDGGDPLAASLDSPRDIEFGPDGRLYISDRDNHRIRAVDFDAGIITTVAGNGTRGFSGDGGLATSASLNRPDGIEFDPEGYLYIADSFNHRIRRVSP